jgi:hypothetical protein
LSQPDVTVIYVTQAQAEAAKAAQHGDRDAQAGTTTAGSAGNQLTERRAE